MELIVRVLFHNIQKFLYVVTGLTNDNVYVNNIKRIQTIINNEYRGFVGEEFSGESQGSCTMVQESVSNDENVERTDDFEYPDNVEGDGSEQDSTAESDGGKSKEE